MTFVFRPSILKSSILTELPRPVLSLKVQDGWDYQQFKVPLADGDLLSGHSRDGVDIAIEGQCGTLEGSVLGNESEMFGALEALRALVNVSTESDKFRLFLYHDSASSTYRHFAGCSCVRFESDLSDPHVFSYSMLIHADDPAIHTTSGDS